MCSRQAPAASSEMELSIPPQPTRAELAASCESVGREREAYGRSARRDCRAKRRRDGVRFTRLDASDGRPPRPGVDGVQLRDRGRACNEGDHVVEIVVIPIAADPCRIGRVRVGSRGKSGDEDDEQERAESTEATHTVLSTRKPRPGQDCRRTQRALGLTVTRKRGDPRPGTSSPPVAPAPLGAQRRLALLPSRVT